MLFTYDRVSLCFLNVRRSWTFSRLLNREMHYHCAITEPTAMCWLSCFILFWNTKYNTPRTFCLANYSVVFCGQCLDIATNPSNTQTAYEPLGATPRTNTLPFLIPINWTGLVVKSAPPVTFHLLRLPLRAGKQMFFPQHPASLLQPPVAEWSDPHGPEQACLNELLLAELCRHTSFGCVTTVILH